MLILTGRYCPFSSGSGAVILAGMHSITEVLAQIFWICLSFLWLQEGPREAMPISDSSVLRMTGHSHLRKSGCVYTLLPELKRGGPEHMGFGPSWHSIPYSLPEQLVQSCFFGHIILHLPNVCLLGANKICIRCHWSSSSLFWEPIIGFGTSAQAITMQARLCWLDLLVDNDNESRPLALMPSSASATSSSSSSPPPSPSQSPSPPSLPSPSSSILVTITYHILNVPSPQ